MWIIVGKVAPFMGTCVQISPLRPADDATLGKVRTGDNA